MCTNKPFRLEYTHQKSHRFFLNTHITNHTHTISDSDHTPFVRVYMSQSYRSASTKYADAESMCLERINSLLSYTLHETHTHLVGIRQHISRTETIFTGIRLQTSRFLSFRLLFDTRKAFKLLICFPLCIRACLRCVRKCKH